MVAVNDIMMRDFRQPGVGQRPSIVNARPSGQKYNAIAPPPGKVPESSNGQGPAGYLGGFGPINYTPPAIDPNTGLPYGGYGGYNPQGTPSTPPPTTTQLPAGGGASNSEDTTFRETPGYEYRRDQGARVRQNSLTGRGLTLSGRALKDIERFGQDYGAAEYQNVFNRRASIAGITPPIVSNMNAAGANYAGSISAINQNTGAGLASAYGNMGSALNDSLQGGLNNYMFYQYMNQGG